MSISNFCFKQIQSRREANSLLKFFIRIADFFEQLWFDASGFVCHLDILLPFQPNLGLRSILNEYTVCVVIDKRPVWNFASS